MGLFDKISNMAKDATDKASDLLEIQKLNSRINDERSRITRLKQQIGDHYWKEFENGVALEPEPSEHCRQIAQANEQIKVIEAQIESIKADGAGGENTVRMETKPCPSCGNNVEVGKKFCPECGYNMESEVDSEVAAEPAEPAESSAKCPSCGSEIESGLKFCPECGQKLD